MNLRRLHGDVTVLPDRILAGEIALEGMAAFMGYDIYVTAGPVEVCKNEGRIIDRHIGHIAPGSLGLAAQHIEQLVLHHEIIELFGLGGKLAVHLPARRKNLLRAAEGRGISVIKIYRIVDIAQLLKPQPLSSAVMELLRKGNQILLHLLPEGLHLLLAVTVAHHLVIAQLHKILISHLLGLSGAVLHQLIIQLVQLLHVGHEEIALSLPRRLSDISVRIDQVRPHQG